MTSHPVQAPTSDGVSTFYWCTDFEKFFGLICRIAKLFDCPSCRQSIVDGVLDVLHVAAGEGDVADESCKVRLRERLQPNQCSAA